MADILAANVTVTLTSRKVADGIRHVYGQIAFGDGALTYAAAGIPLSVTKLGFLRNVASLQILEANANGFRYEWDKSANTLRIMRQNVRTGSTAAADSASGALAENSNAAETALRAMGTAIDTDYDLGPGKEAAATHTPAATTLEFYATGW